MEAEYIWKDTEKIKNNYELWEEFQIRYALEKDVILMLANDNLEFDLGAVTYLKTYMKRNLKDKAHIFYFSDKSENLLDCIADDAGIAVHRIKEEEFKSLYELYSFYKFYNNIFFTYTDYPKDNLLGRILRETDISEREAVCLALYKFRKVIEVEADHV